MSKQLLKSILLFFTIVMTIAMLTIMIYATMMFFIQISINGR
jgi:hypothetical protein